MYTVGQPKKRTFEFEVDGKVYSVPSLATLDLDAIMAYADAIRGGDDLAFVLYIVDNIFPEDAAACVRKLQLGQSAPLIRAYIAEGSETVGESKA